MYTELDSLFALKDINKAIDSLPYKEQLVIRARIDGYSLREIGEFMGITRQGVHGWFQEAIASLAILGVVPEDSTVRYNTDVAEPFVSNHPDVAIYRSMMSRCYISAQASYCYYGYLGVEVCMEWATNPPQFFEDMGPRPEGFSIDRIDPRGDYCPENCRWADTATQIANRQEHKELTKEERDWFYRDTRVALSKATKRWSIKNPNYQKELSSRKALRSTSK